MRIGLRQATMIAGVVFTAMGLGWLIAPTTSAANLGMPLLDGVGRSTQIGDFASFFLTAGITMLLGTRRGSAHLLYVPAALIGGACITRTLAWLLHDAAFAASLIATELAVGILLFRAASQLDNQA